MYILKKGRAGILYNAGETEVLSLETMIRMSLDDRKDGKDELGLHFPEALALRSPLFKVTDRNALLDFFVQLWIIFRARAKTCIQDTL